MSSLKSSSSEFIFTVSQAPSPDPQSRSLSSLSLNNHSLTRMLGLLFLRPQLRSQLPGHSIWGHPQFYFLQGAPHSETTLFTCHFMGSSRSSSIRVTCSSCS